MTTYVMLGLFRGDRFGYARALADIDATTSVILKKVAESIRCIENLDRYFDIYIPNAGFAKTDKICVIDKAIIDGSFVELRTILYVVENDVLKPLHCEAILGRDIFLWWRLVYDKSFQRVKSLIAQTVQ